MNTTAFADPPDWKQIATDLYEALQSFMAYDGYGQGGVEEGNRGDWKKADKAQDAYAEAIGDG